MATSSNSRLRIYGPDNLGIGDDEFSADQELDSGIGKELRAKIRTCYGKVKRLKGVSGFCFGLLDPVSNIIANVAISKCVLLLKQEEEDEGEEVEEEEQRIPDQIGDMTQRSCDGLVAFLVALFPYLTDYRAMWYLNMAGLDPLVAARLIINHRGMEGTFGFTSDTTVAAVETALRCAAAAAQHPNPHQFALGWKLLSPSLHEVPSHPSQLINVIPLLLQQQPPPPVVLCLEKSWELASRRLLKINLSLGEMNNSTMRRMLLTTIELASGRLLKLNPPEMPPVPRPTVRRMLLTTIHGYYLQALAWLPKDKLRSHYHHSLLQAGHCYGPLDPVSNIILNTLWYSQAYPLKLEKKVEIEAISSKALMRIAVRSLYGLVSFLCTRCPALMPGEAMRRLQLARANLQIVDDLNHTAKRNRDDGAIMVSVEEAYVAAAKAAHHPKPQQQAEFLGPSNPVLCAFSQVLQFQDPGKIHELCLYYFRALGSSSKPAEETKNINVLGPWDYSYVMRMVDDLWNQHNRAVQMVKSAIDMYSQQHGVPKYELHVICGVNEFVDGPVHVTPFERTYRCSHINFLATQTASTPPELFFAECRNDGSGVELCYPVAVPLPDTEEVRCLYCEVRGSRIVHPAKESFQGRNREFEKMLGGEEVYSERHTNDDIISGSHYETLRVDILEEDRIYVDYICDNNKVEEKFLGDDILLSTTQGPSKKQG